MPSTSLMKNYLKEKGVGYQILSCPRGVSIYQAVKDLNVSIYSVAQASLLRDEVGMLLAIYPLATKLDLAKINRLTQRNFTYLSAAGTYVPMADAYQLECVVDESLSRSESVYMVINTSTLCKVSGKDFRLIQGKHARFELSIVLLENADNVTSLVIPSSDFAARREKIQKYLEKTTNLPAMPRSAHELLQISNNPYSTTADLAAVIETDPSLSAQLLRYARSPFYGYRGEVDSVQDAIARVLGFDMVIDMSLGISLGKAFRNPTEGPLGLNAFWRHATYCAVLTQKLGSIVEGSQRPRPGMTYLAGLLHNFGFLLLGHLFLDEFTMLNKAVIKNPEASVHDLERKVLGVSHVEIGAWLMRAWNMPNELIISVREHHNIEYTGQCDIYANLICIANRLLSSIGIGDEPSEELPQNLLNQVGLSAEQAIDVFQSVMENQEGLDYMAVQMAA